ncbi:MAG: hypothetical protein Q9184_003490 [Pyrenodesmia sp. 2 TL-2023]
MGWPLPSSSRPESERWTAALTPDAEEHGINGWRHGALGESSRPSSTHANSVFEFRANGTAKSSWLRKMSTMSSSRGGSPVSTPVPDSPSVSYSNGSTVPILHDFSNVNPAITHPNKLVKRSTSQRALNSTTMHSTLRRPATSHQRSATLLQQHERDESPALRATPRSSMLFTDLQEEETSSDESLQSWQCLFRPKNVRPGRDGSSRARNTAGNAHRNQTLKTIVPGIDELPALLLATSIRPRSAEDFGGAGRFARFDDSRPFTPAGMEEDSEEPQAATGSGRRKTKADTELDPRPRRSFSIADMFPSPSPSTWKFPRSGSLRRPKGSVGVSSGRRAVSAPQSAKPRHIRGLSLGKPGHTLLARSKPHLPDDTDTPSPNADPINPYGRAASSPLPPLNRLSAFEIDLPGAAPSYPTTPQSDLHFSTSRLSSPPSPSMSSPSAPFSNRNRSFHPSLAISDKGSTLLGSDNDNSRMLSGDEDDYDFRSETVFDSTRTGATGSSHSNLRKPPIETIFDESIATDYQRNKTMALQDILSHDSFNSIDVQRNRIAEEEESIATPVRAAPSSKGSNHQTPLHVTPKQPAGNSTSPAVQLEDGPIIGGPNPPEEQISDEDVWAIESLSVSEHSSGHEQPPALEFASPPVSDFPALPDFNTNGSGFDPVAHSSDSAPKSNISGWSESSHVSRDLSVPKPRMPDIQGKETRGSRTTARRGPSALHSRSQSVPLAPESSNHRANTSKLEAWVLGNKGVSEDWDCDFDFEENSPARGPANTENEPIRTSVSSGMLVPRSIVEKQASVHGQFGHVKELTILVEELKVLRQQATILDVMNGPSAELWREADGIINLATLDEEEQDYFPPRSPNSPGFDFDPFEEDSPTVSNRRRSTASPSRDYSFEGRDRKAGSHTPVNSTPERSKQDTPQGLRPRKESVAKAKSVLETIHQQRTYYSHNLSKEKTPQKKLPFDTTSLRDLVTRAGVVKRALKEIVRRAEKAADNSSPSSPSDPPSRDSTPPNPPPKPDPPFSQIFQPPNPSAPTSKSPRVTQSPKGSNNNNFRPATIAGNDNEINGHMKMMTVV